MRHTRTNETEYRIWQAWSELRRGAAARRLRKSVLADPEGRPLDVPQVDTLRAVVRNDGMLMGDVARALVIDPSTATRAIDKLEDRGLVRRERLTENARFIKVTPTEHGRETVAHIDANEWHYMKLITRRIRKADREKLAELMEALLDGLDNVFADEMANGHQERAPAGTHPR